MYRVSKSIHFCYAHRLLDYEGLCRHLHGHNGRAVVELVGETLDQAGMVYEFGQIAADLKGWIDQNLDHRTLLREDDPLVGLLKQQNEPLYLMKRNPTAETIAKEIFDYAKSRGLPVCKVTLWETDSACASYEGA